MSSRPRARRKTVPKSLDPMPGKKSAHAGFNLYMSAVIDQGFLLKTLVELFRNSVRVVDFVATDNRLTIRAVNEKRTVINRVDWPAGQLSEWTLHEPIAVRVNIHLLHIVTKNATKSQKFELFIRENSKRIVEIGTDVRGGGQLSACRAVKLDSTHVEDDDAKYINEPGLCVRVETSKYNKLCRDMHNLSKTTRIQRNGTTVKFSLADNKLIRKELSWEGSATNGMDLTASVSRIFQFSHLYSFSKINSLAKVVEIYVYDSDDMAMRMVVNIENYGQFTAYISPSESDEVIYALPPSVDPVC